MSTHPILAHSISLTSGTLQFLSGTITGGSQVIATPVAKAGTLRNLVIRRDAAVSSGSATYTIFKNGSSTSLAVTISAGNSTGSDTTNSVSIAANDTVHLVISTTGAPGATQHQLALDWEPTTEREHVFGFGSGTAVTGPYWPAIYGVNGQTTLNDQAQSLLPVGGTFTGLVVNIRTAPGVGNSRTYCLNVDGTDQDGTGGTTDTRVTISDTNTIASASFSLAVSAGQRVAIHNSGSSGTPASFTYITGSVGFVTAANQSLVGCGQLSSNTNTDNYQWAVSGYNSTSISATESDRYDIGAQTSFQIDTLYLDLANPMSGSQTRTSMLRVNGADTTLSVTITGANESGFNTVATPITINVGDTLDLKHTVDVGTPSSTTTPARWGLAKTVTATNIFGDISGSGIVAGNLTTGIRCQANISGTASVAGSLNSNILLTSAISSAAQVAGNLTVISRGGAMGLLVMMP